MSDPVLVELRQRLHQLPELAGGEEATAELIREFLQGQQPDELVEQLGGHGVAAVFDGAAAGPTVMLRCELDALPVAQPDGAEPKAAHSCGHDGHMAILCGVARTLAQNRPHKGRVVLLFQPAEETGAGAASVCADPRFMTLKPDRVFALHNMPGYPLGQISYRSGTMACASRGLVVLLGGRPAHAAWPEDGLSPAGAISRIIPVLQQMNAGNATQGIRQVTVVHVHLGEPAFGVAPAEATLMATLRSDTDEGMDRLVSEVRQSIQREAETEGLSWTAEWRDVFPATINDLAACNDLQQAAAKVGLPCFEMDEPMRASEDFGHFTDRIPGTLFGLGAGTQHPPLHTREYDFPDPLLDVGVRLWQTLLDAYVGR